MLVIALWNSIFFLFNSFAIIRTIRTVQLYSLQSWKQWRSTVEMLNFLKELGDTVRSIFLSLVSYAQGNFNFCADPFLPMYLLLVLLYAPSLF